MNFVPFVHSEPVALGVEPIKASTIDVLGMNRGGSRDQEAADREVEPVPGTCKTLGPYYVFWPRLWRHLLPIFFVFLGYSHVLPA